MTEQNAPTSPLRRGAVRALAPASVVAIVATGAALAPQFAAAAPTLPPISAQSLLAKVAQSKVTAYSGTVALTTNLGLPALPDLAGGANPLSLLGGTHTLQVAANGPDRQRIALLDTMSEYDLVHNGSQIWIYDSSQNTVEHGTASGDAGTKHEGADKAGEVPLTPQQAAQRLLAAVDPTTKVTVDGTRSVAGRGAYTLVLTPKQKGTLIGRVEIAVDAQNGAPLQVAVYPTGSGTAVFELGFTSVSFSAPSDAQFDFTPPKGATVQQLEQPQEGQGRNHSALSGLPTQGQLNPIPLGTGWLSVVELHGVDLNALARSAGGSGGSSGSGRHQGNDTGLFNGDASSYLDALLGAGKSVNGAFGGGKLYTTGFLSVLVTNDGRLFAGAVTPAVLEADAASQGTK
jgi:outer membrane lipoprotein-sorting protein